MMKTVLEIWNAFMESKLFMITEYVTHVYWNKTTRPLDKSDQDRACSQVTVSCGLVFVM